MRLLALIAALTLTLSLGIDGKILDFGFHWDTCDTCPPPPPPPPE